MVEECHKKIRLWEEKEKRIFDEKIMWKLNSVKSCMKKKSQICKANKMEYYKYQYLSWSQV